MYSDFSIMSKTHNIRPKILQNPCYSYYKKSQKFKAYLPLDALFIWNKLQKQVISAKKIWTYKVLTKKPNKQYFNQFLPKIRPGFFGGPYLLKRWAQGRSSINVGVRLIS